MNLRYIQTMLMLTVSAILFFGGYALHDIGLMAIGLLVLVPAGVYAHLASIDA